MNDYDDYKPLRRVVVKEVNDSHCIVEPFYMYLHSQPFADRTVQVQVNAEAFDVFWSGLRVENGTAFLGYMRKDGEITSIYQTSEDKVRSFLVGRDFKNIYSPSSLVFPIHKKEDEFWEAFPHNRRRRLCQKGRRVESP